MEDKSIGIIGMGEMGKMYAKRLSDAGWRVNVCDRPDQFEQVQVEFQGRSNINVMLNGHLVSRSSDWIMYSVEAENIERVVQLYGPCIAFRLFRFPFPSPFRCQSAHSFLAPSQPDAVLMTDALHPATKQGAIVGGQTSCKAPEVTAFETYLPSDVDIVTCHSLHGPNVSPVGQPLVIIDHRSRSPSSKAFVETVLSTFGSKLVYLTAQEHDMITADTQAVTHAAFLSMGTAWRANEQFPWETSRYVGGIENVKINITLRIYSNKWHVYAGLAILNPSAKLQIHQYAQSVTELFKLMLGGQRKELEERVKGAGRAVFGTNTAGSELLLRDEVLDRFSLGKGMKEKTPNNHLSLLAMVDCWARLGIEPYKHMICSTPLFRLWLGATEYLFRNPLLLDDVLDTAVSDNTFRSDDLEFTFAARGWSDCVTFGDMAAYRDRFERIQSYFAPRFPEAIRVGNEMIATILKKTG